MFFKPKILTIHTPETVETIFENWLMSNPQGGTFTHEKQVFEVWQKPLKIEPTKPIVKTKIVSTTNKPTGLSLEHLVTLAKAAMQKNLSMNEDQQHKYFKLWFKEMQPLTTVTETDFLTAIKNSINGKT